MLEIIKRFVLCFLILVQIISTTGCAAAWFVAGAGAAAVATAVIVKDEKQSDDFEGIGEIENTGDIEEDL